MNLLMLGTGPFAVPTLELLLSPDVAGRHRVVAVVTRPPRDVRARYAAAASPMRQVAERAGLPLLAPEDINTDDARAQLAAFSPDLLVVCDYGQILAPETLAVARHGGVNLHGSLLPKYRGAAPVQWAVWNGDAETGVTVIQMSPRLDAGPTLAIARTPIGEHESADELEQRLSRLGAPLVVECVDALAAGTATALPQPDAQATKARRLRKTDGEIDWRQSAVQIDRQIRALKPWPRTFTQLVRADGEPLRVILDRARPIDGPANGSPGEIVLSAGTDLAVATGEGLLAIESLQPVGKRVQTAAEFVRGQRIKTGDRFGS